MREDILMLAGLFFACYLLFFSFSVKSLNASCTPSSTSESGDAHLSMCTGTDISTSVTKKYFWGFLELPVYRWGLNLELLHYFVFGLVALLGVTGAVTDKH